MCRSNRPSVMLQAPTHQLSPPNVWSQNLTQYAGNKSVLEKRHVHSYTVRGIHAKLGQSLLCNGYCWIVLQSRTVLRDWRIKHGGISLQSFVLVCVHVSMGPNADSWNLLQLMKTTYMKHELVRLPFVEHSQCECRWATCSNTHTLYPSIHPSADWDMAVKAHTAIKIYPVFGINTIFSDWMLCVISNAWIGFE